MNLRDYQSVSERRKALEKELGIVAKNIGAFTLDESVASTRNCENMIGAVQVPLGVAGPLGIAGKDYYIPLATTEGALVASVSRGCKAITESGGAAAESHRIGATRGPVFRVKNLRESKKLHEFFKKDFGQLKKISEATSHHLTLKKISSRGVGHYHFARFVFDTQDAMGMNMVTIATQQCIQYIESKTNARCISVAGNWDVDKKPSWLNVVEGRGTEAWAEVTIPAAVLKTVLKTTAQKFFDVWLAKCMIGSAAAGSMAYNAQFANVIAALFLATGQDLGHIGEGSLGITTAEIVDGRDIYVGVHLPDLMVGTVGGGTGLSTQKEALSIIGVTTSQYFAEVVAATVLAGEISLLASLSEGTLAKAHARLARGGT